MIRVFRTKVILSVEQLNCVIKDNLTDLQKYYMWSGILESYDLKAPLSLEELNPKQIGNTYEFEISIKKDITEYSLGDQIAIDFYKKKYNMLSVEEQQNVINQIDSMH